MKDFSGVWAVFARNGSESASVILGDTFAGAVASFIAT